MAVPQWRQQHHVRMQVQVQSVGGEGGGDWGRNLGDGGLVGGAGAQEGGHQLKGFLGQGVVGELGPAQQLQRVPSSLRRHFGQPCRRL